MFVYLLACVAVLVTTTSAARNITKSAGHIANIKPNVTTIRTSKIFPSGRIVGGKRTTITKHPHQVSLEFLGRHICGGSIISATHVVTANHCVGTTKQHYKIRTGTSKRGRQGSLHRIKNIIHHEDYGFNMQGIPINDIAILEVAEPFKFDKTRKAIDIYKTGEEAKADAMCVVTGWGETGSGQADSLRAVTIPIVSKETCSRAYKDYGGIPDGQICAAYYGEGGKCACYGDSGGPLSINGKLVGIVSWGVGCAEAEYPGVYTEVAAYYKWIRKATGNKDSSEESDSHYNSRSSEMLM